MDNKMCCKKKKIICEKPAFDPKKSTPLIGHLTIDIFLLLLLPCSSKSNTFLIYMQYTNFLLTFLVLHFYL